MLVKAYKNIMFLSILAILGVFAWWTDAIFELVSMMTCFMIAKQRYKFKYHCKSSFQCLILSVAVFAIGLRLTLPVRISYVCSGLCGLFIAYFAQYIAELKFIKEDYEYIEPRYNQFVEAKRRADVYTMQESELCLYCKSNMLDEIDEEIVIQRLIYRRKGQDLYDKIGYSKPQMIRREKRIEERLNIKLKQT